MCGTSKDDTLKNQWLKNNTYLFMHHVYYVTIYRQSKQKNIKHWISDWCDVNIYIANDMEKDRTK
jgi:hypothetical protein